MSSRGVVFGIQGSTFGAPQGIEAPKGHAAQVMDALNMERSTQNLDQALSPQP